MIIVNFNVYSIYCINKLHFFFQNRSRPLKSSLPQKPKIVGPAACVHISILTVLFYQKRS